MARSKDGLRSFVAGEMTVKLQERCFTADDEEKRHPAGNGCWDAEGILASVRDGRQRLGCESAVAALPIVIDRDRLLARFP